MDNLESSIDLTSLFFGLFGEGSWSYPDKSPRGYEENTCFCLRLHIQNLSRDVNVLWHTEWQSLQATSTYKRHFRSLQPHREPSSESGVSAVVMEMTIRDRAHTRSNNVLVLTFTCISNSSPWSRIPLLLRWHASTGSHSRMLQTMCHRSKY